MLMEYIQKFGEDQIYSDRYLAYISSIQDKLPAHVYAFAANPSYFNLESPSSLHDSWFSNLNIREKGSGKHGQFRKIDVEVILLGPRHNRHIH
jgi:hypothetical protein